MPFFGTTAFAAPGLGIITGLIMFLLGTAWLTRRSAKARAAGEGYGHHDDNLPVPDGVMREHVQSCGFDINELTDDHADAAEGPPFWLALAPVVIVIAVNFAFIRFLVPIMNTAFLAEPRFGATTIENVRGVWAIIVSLFLSILFLSFANRARFESVKASLKHGGKLGHVVGPVHQRPLAVAPSVPCQASTPQPAAAGWDVERQMSRAREG